MLIAVRGFGNVFAKTAITASGASTALAPEKAMLAPTSFSVRSSPAPLSPTTATVSQPATPRLSVSRDAPTPQQADQLVRDVGLSQPSHPEPAPTVAESRMPAGRSETFAAPSDVYLRPSNVNVPATGAAVVLGPPAQSFMERHKPLLIGGGVVLGVGLVWYLASR